RGQRPPSPRAGGAPPYEVARVLDKQVRLTLTTERGAIALELYPDRAPAAVASLVALVETGFYKGLSVHRVVPDFVIQGGDPRGDGSGGPGYNVPCEVSPERFERGAVGIALAGKDTGGSQLFVMQADHPHLDGRYPLIGRVVSGMELVDAMVVG